MEVRLGRIQVSDALIRQERTLHAHQDSIRDYSSAGTGINRIFPASDSPVFASEEKAPIRNGGLPEVRDPELDGV